MDQTFYFQSLKVQACLVWLIDRLHHLHHRYQQMGLDGVVHIQLALQVIISKVQVIVPPFAQEQIQPQQLAQPQARL